MTTTRSPGAARGRANGAERAERRAAGACGRRRRVENASSRSPARQECDEPLALLILQPDVLDAADRRVDDRRAPPRSASASARSDVCPRPPPPLAGMQPSSGRKLESARVVRATKTARGCVVTPGLIGPPSVAEERDLERAGAVGVEAADHLAAAGAARAGSRSASRPPCTGTQGPATGMQTSSPSHSVPALGARRGRRRRRRRRRAGRAAAASRQPPEEERRDGARGEQQEGAARGERRRDLPLLLALPSREPSSS